MSKKNQPSPAGGENPGDVSVSTGSGNTFYGPVSIGNQPQANQNLAASAAAVPHRPRRKKPLRTIVIVVVVVLLIVGSIIAFSSDLRASIAGQAAQETPSVSSEASVSAQSSPVVQASPTSQIASSSVATPDPVAESLYKNLLSRRPNEKVIPADAHQWGDGSPSRFGSCTKKVDGYHAIAKGIGQNYIMPCISLTSAQTGNYALQSNLTLLVGSGFGIVFGYQPSQTIPSTGDFYAWVACVNSLMDSTGDDVCPQNHAFLDRSSSITYFATCVAPKIAADCGYALHNLQNQADTFTVIVYHQALYLYINGFFVYTFTPGGTTPSQTDGFIGFITIGADVVCPEIDVWQL